MRGVIRTRVARALTLACLLLLTYGTALVGTSGTPADAVCNGQGNPRFYYRYDANGTLVAEEGATYPGSSCNDGNFSYSGALLDPVSDGSCAYAYYLEPLQYYATQGTACTTGQWSFYGYTDVYGSNNVYVSARPSYLSDVWYLSSGY